MIRLDLHGVRHSDVKRKVIRILEENWGDEDDIEIITGHSLRMKDIVLEVLQEYKLPHHTGFLYDINSPRIITWTY